MPAGIPSLEKPQRPRAPTIFGTRLRTAILMLVAALEETYPAELSRYLGTSISNATRPHVVRAIARGRRITNRAS